MEPQRRAGKGWGSNVNQGVGSDNFKAHFGRICVGVELEEILSAAVASGKNVKLRLCVASLDCMRDCRLYMIREVILKKIGRGKC